MAPEICSYAAIIGRVRPTTGKPFGSPDGANAPLARIWSPEERDGGLPPTSLRDGRPKDAQVDKTRVRASYQRPMV